MGVSLAPRTAAASGIRAVTGAAAVALAACAGPTPRLVTTARVAMGSELRLSAWTRDEAAARAAFDEVFAEFDRLDKRLSIWQPGSDVQRINAAAGGPPVPVAADTLAVLAAARQVSDWTGGKFDITFGALTDIWKFDQDQDGRVPGDDEIAARLPLIDYTAVSVDERAGTASLARPGMRVHLGGIGKGYGVDRAAALLRERGVRDFMIQAGGDLYVGGLRDGRPWRLGLADPRHPDGPPFGRIDLTDATFSTSGDYERFFIKDGVRYHHLLDPDLGHPARGCRSVTIVATRAMLADALSTGVFIMGPDAGLALIERLEDVEGVIVTSDDRVLVSSGLRGRFVY
jgi:thiamine biosynthesis lipoprotein